MRRVALLGATGSIGRQAVEIVEGHPELELVAAASGSQPLDGLAPLTQVGGDLTELLERARAGRRPERRRRLRRAAGDALGPRARCHARAREQGEPRRRRRARAPRAGAGRRPAAPRGQRALGRLPVPRGAAVRAGPLARPDRLPAGPSAGGRARSSRTSSPRRRWRTRPGRWARRSPSTRRRSRTKGSS